MRKSYDLILIGGGIVGVSTAWHLKRRYPDASVAILEKESSLAQHQTGRNSGVIHAGVYYAPGSLKADFCRRGAAQTIAFCREHDIAFEQCGKLLVATDTAEIERMGLLEQRCRQNRIEIQRLTGKQLKKLEPEITGAAALLVPATGITDYPKITDKMAALFTAMGGEIHKDTTVKGIREGSQTVIVQTGKGVFESGYLLACGGLMADRLAKMMDIDVDFQIIPFRGEYYRLSPRHNRLVSHLIYPIPDPDLPFLGVHLTRMIDGSITVGPNAVLGFKREGYNAVNIDPCDIAEMAMFPGFWKVIGSHLKSGLEEMRDSFYKPGYLERVRKYCPKLKLKDLHLHPVGIRAQAVKKDGGLVHDFLFTETDRSFHVCNAPSPAATSAMPIGEYLCKKAAEKFRL